MHVDEEAYRVPRAGRLYPCSTDPARRPAAREAPTIVDSCRRAAVLPVDEPQLEGDDKSDEASPVSLFPSKIE